MHGAGPAPFARTGVRASVPSVPRARTAIARYCRCVFPTEQQVYHRLRWDDRFDVKCCHVVITLRPSGTKRLPFLELDTEVVPWHRIVEFWIEDELAWS